MADVSKQCWEEWTGKKAVANAGVAVINSHNEVLLLLKPIEEEWGLPSGGIDRGENPKMAAVRELFEETKITLPESRLTEIGTFTAFHSGYTEGKTDIIVTFIAFSDEHATVSPEHSATMWLSLGRTDDPSIKMHPTTRRQIQIAYEIVNLRNLHK